MTKNELIELLQKVDGNPEIWRENVGAFACNRYPVNGIRLGILLHMDEEDRKKSWSDDVVNKSPKVIIIE